MKKPAALLALLLAGCGSEQGAAVMMIEPGYTMDVAGTMASGFTSPDGLRWDAGELLMADESGVAIRRWRADGKAETLVDGAKTFSSPEDLVRDKQGAIWFTDDNIGGVRRLAPDGTLTLVAGPKQGLVSTEGIALAENGEIYAGDGKAHRIFAVSADGKVRDVVTPDAGIAKPESMAFDGKGNLYIADNEDDVLYLLSPDGDLTAAVKGRSDFSPESIVWDKDALLVTDSKNHKLWRYDPHKGLSAIASFAGEFANIQGVAPTPDGDIFLTIRAGDHDDRGYLLKLTRKHSS